jgi:hypothetical protein
LAAFVNRVSIRYRSSLRRHRRSGRSRALAIAFFLSLGTAAALATPLAGGSAIAAEACPNAMIRASQSATFLPECRAYEEVTPPYKQGYDLSAAVPGAYAADGARVVLASLAGLRGVEGQGESAVLPAIYEAVRGPLGWALSPISPSNAVFGGEELIAAEAQSGVTLWALNRAGESSRDATFFIRGLGGDLTEIGPIVPPQVGEQEPSDSMNSLGNGLTFLSATASFGHLIFAAKTDEDSFETKLRWPGDATMAGWSLYEYSGEANRQPRLIAVRGGAGSSELIGECGAAFGSEGETSYQGTTYDALSADGEVVFFTPVAADDRACGGAQPTVGEIYARVAGSTSSAHTENVSGPQPGCGGQCAENLTNPSDRHFEGASSDGSRVFFTSTQALTTDATEDPAARTPNHPEEPDSASLDGGCAATVGAGGCNLYEYRLDRSGPGTLRLVAGGEEVLGTSRISRNGAWVYFVARGAVAGSGSNQYAATPVPGSPNLYAYDSVTAETHFVATLSTEDASDWQQQDTRPVQATADGSFLVFLSANRLTPGTTTEAPQLYEYAAESGELVRISVGEEGYADDGNAPGVGPRIAPLDEAERFSQSSFHQAYEGPKNLSGDGSTFAFGGRGRLSPDALSAEAGCFNVYEFHTDGLLREGTTHLISDGQDVGSLGSPELCGSDLSAIDASAADIFIRTGDSLVPADRDGGQLDLYDAHVGGGFTEESAPAGCLGEGCIGPLPAGSAASAPVTETIAAPPPARHPRKHRKHRKARRHRQAPKRHRRHHGKATDKKKGRG